MGRLNDFMCDYLGLAQYHADFWNGTVFHGKRRVKIWQLERRDREYYKTQHNRCKKPGSVRKDVQMLCRGKKNIIFAIEVMTTLDYSIPVRVMDYDAQELMRQIKDIGHRNKAMKERQRKGMEKPYINNLSKKDRLVPIHTVVLYCGEKGYDGVTNVRDLLDAEGLVQDYQRLLRNCPVRIYDLKNLREENYETSLKEIIAIFKRSKDRESVKEYYLAHKDRFRQMDEISINVLGALIGISKLKLFPQEEGGGVDLCKAFEDEREEGRIEGRKEGAFSTLCCLVQKGMLKLKDAAGEAGMSEEVFQERMQSLMHTSSTIGQ